MELMELMDKIALPEEGQKCVLSQKMDEQQYLIWKNIFYSQRKYFFEKLELQENKEALVLYLYLRFAADMHEEYLRRQISDQIYFDTCSDITVWFKYCVREKHIIGLTREQWIQHHLSMEIFRLGRLQFEPDPSAACLHVHIPEGESLTEESCNDSFLQADSFFDSSYRWYVCESWLLSPDLGELLQEDSNILRFQKRFEIEKVDRNSRQAEERVFGEIREDTESYPETSSLQRKLKKMLLSGKNPGMGIGRIKR